MNYKQIARTYHAERYFYEGIEDFLESKKIAEIEGEQVKKELIFIEEKEEEQKRDIESCIKSEFNAIKMQGSINTIVIHKSTRNAGEYQITTFYKDMPISDSRHDNKEELLEVLLREYLQYEIKEIV